MAVLDETENKGVKILLYFYMLKIITCKYLMYIINVKLYLQHGRSLLHIAEMMGKKVTLRLFERFIIIIDDYLTKLLNSLL